MLKIVSYYLTVYIPKKPRSAGRILRSAFSGLMVLAVIICVNVENAGAVVVGSYSQHKSTEDTTAHYEKVVLTGKVTYPMELAVAEDGRVFIGERNGVIKMWDPSTDATKMVGFLPVKMIVEDGLLGLTIDPDFEQSGWLYVYYAPADGGPNRLSRLTFADGHLDLSEEAIILEVPVQREKCCHSAGSLTFGPAGNLYLSTGDNTDPYPLGGSAIDERAGKEYGDAQRTAANTNDLRGKILRIRPTADGGYTIPEGNLFKGDSLHRPEIYTMGHRNPYRISVDPQTGWLYWGDIGIGNPPSDERGPWGWEEFNQARRPGFYGWPYFAGPNDAYRDYDYATETPGDFFDPDNPVNDSPNNTGVRDLPPAQPALVWYTYGQSSQFPELEAGGMSAMAGPVYRYDAETASQQALPAEYDGSLFVYEWMRNWVKEVELDDQGELVQINSFLPGIEFTRPMDMEIGPRGRLYVIEWGKSFWGANRDAQIVRVDYYGEKARTPQVAVDVKPTSGSVPLEVRLEAEVDGRESADPDFQYEWDFDNDGVTDARERSAVVTYEKAGQYRPHLTVTDVDGRQYTVRSEVSVGNTPPDVRIVWPPSGGFFDYGEPIPYEVAVSDTEDDSVGDGSVTVQVYSGHDQHRHLLSRQKDLTGHFSITEKDAHVPDVYLIDQFGVLEARYTDGGTRGVPSITTSARVILQPKRKEAEHFADSRGAERTTFGKHPAEPDFAETALTAMLVEDGGELVYEPVNLLRIEAIEFKVKPEAAGTIEVRLGGSEGPLIAKADVSTEAELSPSSRSQRVKTNIDHDKGIQKVPEDVQSAYEGWQNIRVPVEDPGGTHRLHIAVHGEKEGTLMQLDYLEFLGQGVMERSSK